MKAPPIETLPTMQQYQHHDDLHIYDKTYSLIFIYTKMKSTELALAQKDLFGQGHGQGQGQGNELMSPCLTFPLDSWELFLINLLGHLIPTAVIT